jgi:hypothetical protein
MVNGLTSFFQETRFFLLKDLQLKKYESGFSK